jgi:predicted acylesterase/phospholipase RssA
LSEVPTEIRQDLAERYRQIRPFDEAETSLVRALVRRPNRLAKDLELSLRRSLNLARLWVVENGPMPIAIGPFLGSYRDLVLPIAKSISGTEDLDPLSLGAEAERIRALTSQTEAMLQSTALRQVDPLVLEDELKNKALVLALGGGGGCGYAHLGAFAALENVSLRPALISGTSIGAVMGLFRARSAEFRPETVRNVTDGLSFRRLFRVLDGESRYALPGALRLYLRSVLTRFFLNERGETLRISELHIPFVCAVTGVRREAETSVRSYSQTVAGQLNQGAFGRLLHMKNIVQRAATLLSELAGTPGALQPIALGGDDQTSEFDVIDAAGFSSALPMLIQYDLLRDDPRMHELVQATLSTHEVDHFADGGLASNVPARAAWEYIQEGRLGTRNTFILGLDCFAPQFRRNMLFLPLQRLAAENVARDDRFAHLIYAYRKVLSPLALVPKGKTVELAIRNGREELEEITPFVRKMLEPIPPNKT